MAPLPYIGHLEYNGYRFPSLVKVSCTARRITDSSNRTTKSIQYTIRAEAEIESGQVGSPLALVAQSGSPGLTTGYHLEDIRRRLLETGKYLIFGGFGFSGLYVNLAPGINYGVNSGFSQMDINFGPHPQVLEWLPIGGSLCSLVKWECVVEVPECSTTPDAYGNPHVYTGITGAPLSVSSYNYDVGWKVSAQGLMTRTVKIDAEIPLTRDFTNPGTVRERILKDSADRIIDRIKVPKIDGYARDSSVQIDKSKRILNVVITDSMLPSDNPYVVGCVGMNMSHSISSNLHASHNLWKNTISGSITLAPGVQKWVAWLAFAAIVTERISHENKAVYTSSDSYTEGDKGEEEKKKGGLKYVTDFSMTEEIFGRTMSFSLSWELLSNLKTIFKASGLMSPLELNSQNNDALGAIQGYYNWRSWSDSMNEFTKLRGISGFKMNPSTDIIVDLCQNQGLGLQTLPGESQSDIRDLLERILPNVLTTEHPTPGNSWKSFENRFDFMVNGKALKIHTASVPPKPSPVEEESNFAPAPTDAFSDTETSEPPGSTISLGTLRDDKQYTVKPQNSDFVIRMSGSAERMKYKITSPDLIQIGGYEVESMDRDRVTESSVPSLSGCRINRLAWKKYYTLASTTSLDAVKPAITGNKLVYSRESVVITNGINQL